ncbi:MAG TPA: hypothetical protein VJQ58_15195 [Burkholderiales bacterium]|nr:hypothetical protein [Burkholderiales bacterium]
MAERARPRPVFLLLTLLIGACNQASAGVEKGSGEKGTGDKAGAVNTAAEAAGPSASSEAAPGCGSGGAECPMQRWMKANLQAFQRSRDYSRLAAAFEQLAELEPKGFDGWAESSRQGAEAATRKDEAGVSKSCETCHKAHRDSYRRTLRSQALSL